jgi:hypothetical protein
MEQITREGALYQRMTSDGMEICVFPRMFSSILTFGRRDDQFGYDTHWCYETPGVAILAAEEWDPANPETPEPEGWFRHANSGRRRPNGDPQKEYVNL